LSEWHVIMRHVFRNALIPIVTIVALNVGGLLGGGQNSGGGGVLGGGAPNNSNGGGAGATNDLLNFLFGA